jgi:HD-like signal output (HDOD) protein/CheY-like chemotaxis protein
VKKRILFVGEDQPLWQEFRTHLSNSDDGWEGEFVRTGPDALARMEAVPFSAFVVDSRLSAMTGVDLLEQLMKRDPEKIRVLLSDISDSRSTLNCAGRPHHHVLKPCDADAVLAVLNQAVALDAWLPNRAVHNIIARMRWLPSPPSDYAEVLAQMRSSDVSVEQIGELISRDPAISAKVLQMANSATFGLQLQVVQPAEAVAYIGLEATRALVLLAHTFSSFDQLHLVGFSGETLWRHSLHTGQLARRIARLENAGLELTELGFASGLLHDIGKLLLAANLTEPYGQAVALARAQRCSLWEAENRVFGTCHSEVGACLLGMWGLPLPIIEAVALHHHPVRSMAHEFSPLTAVHVADVLEHETSRSPDKATLSVEWDVNYLKRLGLDRRMEERRQDCLSGKGPVET